MDHSFDYGSLTLRSKRKECSQSHSQLAIGTPVRVGLVMQLFTEELLIFPQMLSPT